MYYVINWWAVWVQQWKPAELYQILPLCEGLITTKALKKTSTDVWEFNIHSPKNH